MVNLSVSDRILCQRIDKYFYRTPEGTILKYSIYCIKKIVKLYHLIIMKKINLFIVININ